MPSTPLGDVGGGRTSATRGGWEAGRLTRARLGGGACEQRALAKGLLVCRVQPRTTASAPTLVAVWHQHPSTPAGSRRAGHRRAARALTGTYPSQYVSRLPYAPFAAQVIDALLEGRVPPEAAALDRQLASWQPPGASGAAASSSAGALGSWGAMAGLAAAAPPPGPAVPAKGPSGFWRTGVTGLGAAGGGKGGAVQKGTLKVRPWAGPRWLRSRQPAHDAASHSAACPSHALQLAQAWAWAPVRAPLRAPCIPGSACLAASSFLAPNAPLAHAAPLCDCPTGARPP
jgi:hypothetical protein